METISSFYKLKNYLLDPHTAVAVSVASKIERGDVPLLVAATASPLKFAETVLQALGKQVPENATEAVNMVAEIAGVKVPEEISRVLKGEGGKVINVTPDNLTKVMKEVIMKRGEN